MKSMTMNKLTTGVFLAAVMVLGNMTLNAQEGPKQTSEPSVYKGVTDATCAVEVAFGSYGAGIDGAALEKVQAAIAKHKFESTTKPIGREGEIRICLPLKGVSKRKKSAFINELKKIAKEGQLVSVSIR
jgi:hypothetical protein